MSKLETDINPICRFCGERNETFIHLTECPRLRDYQVDSFLGENRAWEWSHEQILKFASCRAVNDAIEEYDFGDYSFMSIIISESSDNSTSPFRYASLSPTDAEEGEEDGRRKKTTVDLFSKLARTSS